MTDYDAETQRVSAIKILETKLRNIYSRVTNNHPTLASFYPHAKRERLQYFNYNCKRNRNFIQNKIPVPRYKHSNSIPSLANQYVKIETLIERLRNGEDPRTLLLEIMSNE